MTPRAKCYLGIDFDSLALILSRVQLAFYPNKTVWFLQQLDTSACLINDRKET
jgi:hypothetical protein